MICDLTELPSEMCSHCRGLDAKPIRVLAERTIPAFYPGACPGCGGRIHPGDSIGLVDGDWLCPECVT